jgi:hypothetical protein
MLPLKRFPLPRPRLVTCCRWPRATAGLGGQRQAQRRIVCAWHTYHERVAGAAWRAEHMWAQVQGESLKRCTRSLGSPGHRLPSSQWLYRQMRPSRRRSANESRCRSLRPPERRQNVVSARSAGALGGETRVFEVRLHLLTPSEADELVHVLVFGREAWPPASELFRAAIQLRTVLASIDSCAGGPL